jgi:gamma-glutamyltranspeptidase / glutathione hydrolase / leukotriene-C4 hydrolase
MPKLANTLKVIAKEGASAFYGDGTFGKKLVEEIQGDGGIITMEDLRNYQPKWSVPTTSKILNDQIVNAFPLPACGDILTFVFNVLNGFHFEEESPEFHKENKLFYHRLIEAFKFAFAKRSKIGDEKTEEVLRTIEDLRSLEHADFIRGKINDEMTNNDPGYYGANSSVQLDYGTGHISIIAPNGDAVAITSTINYV